MNPDEEPLIDFALFTAIETERRAVCKAFRLSDKHRVMKENRVYWRGKLPLPGGKFYEIAVAQSPDMGNIDAAVLATTMIHDWSPGALLLVGIAGAGGTDQKLGDLALGRDVYYHERGKETPAGSKLEPYMYRADALLWNRLTALPKWKTKVPVLRPDGKNDRPQIHYGVIASGEQVIADIVARDQIAAGHRKIVAIEMEGHGVGAALWQSVDRVRGLVIRAICDLADASKNSQWHPYAAAVAAGFVKHFLLDQPLEPRNSPRAVPTKRVQLTLAMEFATFDAKAERLLVHALAGFLDIPPEAVKVGSVEEGSVKLVVELPADAADRLLKASEAGVISLKDTSALSIWQKKLKILEGQNAIAADPTRKFALYRPIAEARDRIRELRELQETPARTSRALALWEEKLAFLKEQEAIAADPSQKYALRMQIQETEEKIRVTLNTSSPGPVGKALKTWEEKLAYLLEQEAIASDAGQRFGLAHQIEEARGKIRELKGLQEPKPAPGTVPLHNLPYPPLGDLFTGRQEELDGLAAGDTPAITQSAAISGLGGIGKTRLAVEYAWRSGNRYTAAWFVRADSSENLRRNLAALAGPELLNLPEWEAQVEEKTVAAVKRWLREHPGWLMLLDNVDTPEAADAVLETLPSLSNGHILITSRLTTWPAGVRKQSLDKLSPEEAIRFLLHRTHGGRESAADDAARTADLAERVDGLPLALEQAAAYIIRHRMRFADYLRAWEQEHDKLLQWYDPRVMQYPASVAVTWKQTFDRLSPTSAALLRLTAFLAPDPIPVELLEQGAEMVKRAAELFCEEAGTAADGKTLQEAMADLANYSLITRQDGGMLVVHRMVQEALRSQIPAQHRRGWVETALRVVDAATETGDPHDVHLWPTLDLLRPHIAQIVVLADQLGISVPTTRLMMTLAGLFYGRGLFFEAERLVRRALAIDEASFGAEHPQVATDLNNLALLLQDTNRLAEAEPLMRRSLAINEAAFGKEHPAVAIDLNNLATLLQDTNRLEEAEPLMRRALAIDQGSFGNEHPKVALRLNNLAMLLQGTNRLEEAEPLMRRALAIGEASFGNEHPKVALRLNNLAKLLHDTNRLEEAESLIRRAVEINEKSLGPEHPITQATRRSLEVLLANIAEASPGGDDAPTAPEAL